MHLIYEFEKLGSQVVNWCKLSLVFLATATVAAPVGATRANEGSPRIAPIVACDDTATKHLTDKASITSIEAGEEKYEIQINTSETPELTEWVQKELAPVVKEWYPKIIKILPSEGFEAPHEFDITFRKEMSGVAYTAGTHIVCAGDWFGKNLKGEARGAVVHEMVHVVQQYGRAKHAHHDAARPPGWLVEGIPDYIRWYLYEPQSHGADMSRRALARARFDGSYRVSANFLNYVTEKYDKSLTEKVNAAIRGGNYSSDLWKTLTGKSLDELNDEWKENLGKKQPGAAGEKKS